jgi:ornithine carbamoyltransferase
MRHLLAISDLTAAEIDRVFSITDDLKTKFTKGLREPLLPGRVMAMLFEKPSLRTRVSFETAMIHLGGSALFLGDEAGFGRRESLSDFARVLSEYVDVVVVRAKRHDMVLKFAGHCSCPVVNGLTDYAHPCQALADLYTVRELFGKLEGHTLAWVGDGNNVARSLAMACGKMGMRFVMSAPDGYRFDNKYLATLRREVPRLEVTIVGDPVEAVRDAVAVYTDVWASMGQEAEMERRRRDLRPYQVNATLMSHTQKGAVFMHCLPARRNEEVTDDVIDGPQSVVVQQAANRMHVQKGVLAWLLATQRGGELGRR